MAGNKGEWSEAYVFLKLLGDGKLYAADQNLNKITDLFYPIIKIIRSEIGSKRDYLTNGEITIIDGYTKEILLKVSKIEFIKKANELFQELKKAKGRSFEVPSLEQFLKSIYYAKDKSEHSKKTDIRIVVHDLHTGLKPTLGFSIKSMIGKEATLFNGGDGTNFIYKFTDVKHTEEEIKSINAIKPTGKESKITLRINSLLNRGAKINFVGVQSENLKWNLELIDTKLPEILAHLLLYKYAYGIKSSFNELLKVLLEKNPLNFNLSNSHPFYEYKLKNFLADAALGMTPEKIWKGIYDATGGIIIVKENGEVVCYHIYNRNDFQDYLLNNTKLNQTSTTRYKWGDLYLQKDNPYIKLNLCVRFND